MQRQIWPEIASRISSLGRVGVAVEQRPGGHHHARGAEAALQAVALHEALLHRVELAVLLEALDRADLVAAGHRGEHGAGLHRLAVQPDHAGAAVAGVAAPVRAGQAEVVAQEVHEQQPALDLAGDLVAVDGHRHLHGQLSSVDAGDRARRSARRVSSSARWRLYSALPRRSVTGLQPRRRCAPAWAYSSSDGAWPRSASEIAGMPVVFGPTAASPTRASAIASPSSQTAAPAETTAQSPARRSTFS